MTALVFEPRLVSAADLIQEDCPDLAWSELDSGDFVILYSTGFEPLARQIQQNYVPGLSNDLGKYQQAFKTELASPLLIRLYPTRISYYCLNPQAVLLGAADAHSHVGSREIALITEVINRQPATWESQAVNALRHEIGALFGEQISDGEAPPGLLQSLGGYMENPEETFEARFLNSGQPTAPDRGWQRLWEEDLPSTDSLTLIQQTSTVAFLIELYGWDQFLAFMSRLPEVSGYRQAVLDIYGVNLQEISSYWERYFSVYVESQWQNNIFHHFDFGQTEQLIAGGAYTDAVTRLEGEIPLIEMFGDELELAQATTLLNLAQQGLEAGELALKARQSVLTGDYAAGLTNAESALTIYAELGDSSRVLELEIYRQLCIEVLELREEVADLSGGVAPLDPLKTERLVEIGRRLSQLGDSEGTKAVQIALLLLGVDQSSLVIWVSVISMVITSVILWRRIRGWRQENIRWGEIL